MATWTDEQKQGFVDAYLAAEPTPANSMEIVKQIAEDGGHSPNAVRMILSQAKDKDGNPIYVKKEAAGKASGGTGKAAASGDKAPRVSKEAAHARLTAAIEAVGKDADSEIISKMTGKAALYFAEVLEAGATED